MVDSNNTSATDDNPNLSLIRTVGELRAALDGIPDDTPLMVNAENMQDPEFVDEQLITSAGFGIVDWGDGRGLVQDVVFGLSCRSASLTEVVEMRNRPGHQIAGAER